jgi:hypothetical protein
MSTVQDDRAAPNKNKIRARASGSRSGSETRRPSKILNVRYPLSDYAELERQAAVERLTVSAFVRKKTSGIAQERGRGRRPGPEQRLAGQYLAQLGKIGSNINQLARVANMNEAGARVFELALQEIQELGQVLRQILRGHG